MKGRKSEVGCIDPMLRGREGDELFFKNYWLHHSRSVAVQKLLCFAWAFHPVRADDSRMLQRSLYRQRETVKQRYGCLASFKNRFPGHRVRYVFDRHPAVDENFQQRSRRWKPGIVSFEAGIQAAIHSRQDNRHMVIVPYIHVYSSRNYFPDSVVKNRRHHSRIFVRIAGMFHQSSFYCGFGVFFVPLSAGFHQRNIYGRDFIRWLYFRRWLSDLTQRNFYDSGSSGRNLAPCLVANFISESLYGSGLRRFYYQSEQF